ncbi:ROK family protein [Neobacillus sp. NPDC097160]|uniref:ROK family protein n=1 Tax=Neobacillus sp. NPDC097160 TaxID=3364298 RepID=UPI00380BA841
MKEYVEQNLAKRMNSIKVLDFIRKKGKITKAELADEAKLTFAAISNIINDLLKNEMIKECGEGISSGGRKPILYELHSEALYVVGIDISVDEKVRFGLFTFNTVLVNEICIKSPTIKGPDEYIQIIKEGLKTLIEQEAIDYQKIVGIGVSIPGPINSITGEVISPPNLPLWRQVPLKRILEKELQIPVKVEKDANLSALGEKWFGAGKEAENLVYLFVGEGIGSGVILNGMLVNHKGFGIGEIGHCSIDSFGPRCNCGNYGCLELKASGLAIVKRVKEGLQLGYKTRYPYPAIEQISFSDILDAIESKDPFTIKAVEEAANYLGIGLTNVINYFNPDLIIIGGKLPEKYEKMIELSATIARNRAIEVFQKGLTIIPGKLKEKSTLMGAAALILADIFRK